MYCSPSSVTRRRLEFWSRDGIFVWPARINRNAVRLRLRLRLRLVGEMFGWEMSWKVTCFDRESNTGPQDLQSCALPTELSKLLLHMPYCTYNNPQLPLPLTIIFRRPFPFKLSLLHQFSLSFHLHFPHNLILLLVQSYPIELYYLHKVTTDILILAWFFSSTIKYDRIT